MKITKTKFVGACSECGEPARTMIDFYWAGLKIWLCEKHMFRPQPGSKETSVKRPKKEIY